MQRDEQPWPVTYSRSSRVEVEAQMNKIDEKRDSHENNSVLRRACDYLTSLTISVYQINREMEMMSDGFVPSGLV